MTASIILISIPVILAAATLLLTAPNSKASSRFAKLNTHFFAHRGLHSKDKSIPENSLPAFAAAADRGYGMELDVQLSKDGRVVVFHDDDLKRACEIDKRVDELTYDELMCLNIFGSRERIPLFSEVLYLVDGRGALIVELKSGRRNRELCEKTYKLLKEYDGKYCIESFDPRIVMWFRRNAPRVIRGQLASPPSSYGSSTSKTNSFLLGNCLMNVLSRPDFIAYKISKKPLTVRLAERLGGAPVCWTSRKSGDNKGNAAEIFEFYEPEVR